MKPPAGLGVFAALAVGLVLTGCGIHNTGAASAPTPGQSRIATATPTASPTASASPAAGSPANSADDPLAGIDSDLATAGGAADQAKQDGTDGDSAGAKSDN